MEVQSTVFYIILITFVIIAMLILINRQVIRFDPLSKPTGVVLLMMMAVDMIDKMVFQNTNRKIAKNLGPYIGSIFAYIFLSNISGLFGLEPPTSNLSVTLVLAGITVLLIEKVSLQSSGIKNYVHSLFEPVAPFVVMNLIGKFSPLLSLSMRLCCNILAGGVIMSIFYRMTGMLSSIIPAVGQMNIFGVLIAPALHIYFDLFSGILQAYLFITLTLAFVGNEVSAE